jgi:hypothetical protein
MATREIKVRLTPEGLAEVIGAIRKVQTEAKEASTSATSSTKALTTALGGLRRVMGAMGLGLSVAGIVAFGRAVAKSATETVDAAKRIGVSAEEFSRLQIAARAAAGSDGLGALEAAARTLQRNLSNALSNPTGEAARAFQQIRIEAREFQKLSLEDQFAVVADAVKDLSNQEDRLRAVMDLMGKSAASLVPLFAEGGTEMKRVADEAQRAGRVLSNETAAGIDRADKAIKRLKSTISRTGRDALGSVVATVFEAYDELTKPEAEKIARDLALSQESLQRALKAGDAGTIARLEERIRALKDAQTALEISSRGGGPSTRRLSTRRAATADDGTDRSQLAKIETPEERRARLELARARIQDAQKIADAERAIRAQADEQAYKDGLISLEAYYVRRRELAQQAGAAEVQALQAQIGLIQQQDVETDSERTRQAGQVDQLRAQIAVRRLELERELAQLIGQQAEEGRKLAEDHLEVANRLDEIEGNRHAAFQRNLAEEIRQLERLGAQIGLTSAEIEAQAARLRTSLTAGFNFEQASSAATSALESFNRDAEQIRRDQEAGLLTQLEGENRLIELARERLEVLRAVSAESMRAALATGDPALIAQAEQQAASVAQIAASFHAATNSAARYRQGLESGLQDGLTGLAANLAAIESLEDAFRQLALTVVQSLAQIAAELLAKQATLAILRAFGGLGGAGAGATGGPVEGYATGGRVRGKRLNIPGPDKIPAMLQEGEYVVRRRVATNPLIAGFLRDLNSGAISPQQLALGLSPPRGYATGGSVSLVAAQSEAAAADLTRGGATQTNARLEGVLGLEEGLVFKQLNSDAFDDLQLYRLSRNPAKFRSALGL